MKVKDQYFKVITTTNGDVAEILLYGIIGQEYWWRESDEDDITDIAFIKKLRELEKDYDRINIRINSPGGSVYHGNAIISAIQNSKAEIHTYNDGLAASMGADIWLAAKHRHMAKNAMMMIHSPSSWVWGTAKQMRKEAELLDKIEYTIIVVTAEALGMDEEEVKEKYYDYEDHWFNAKDCKELGFISKVEDYESENVIDGIEKMSFKQIMAHFSTKEPKEEKNFIEQIANKIMGSITRRSSIQNKISKPQNIVEMKKEDFEKSLESGDLKEEDVINALQEKGYQVEQKKEDHPTNETDPQIDPKKTTEPATPAPTTPASGNVENQTDARIDEKLKPITEAITAMNEAINKLSAAPGAKPSNVASKQDNYQAVGEGKTEEELLKEANEKIYEAGKGGAAHFE